MNLYRLRAYIYLLLVALIWGIAGPVIKVTLNAGLAPDLFLLYRFLFSSIATVTIFIIFGYRFPKKFSTLMLLIGYSIFNSTLSLGFLFWGTEKTSLLDMSLISLISPIITIALGYFYLNDHFTKREKIGTVIALLGSFLILAQPLLERNQPDGQIFGNLLVFASVISGAIAALFAKELLRQGQDAAQLANISFFLGFLTMIPISLYLHTPSQIITTLLHNTPQFYFGITYMGLASGTAAYILNNLALKSIELSETAIFGYLYPTFSAILAVILLGDRVTPTIIAGCALTFVGVFAAETKRRSKPSHKKARK